MILSDREIVDAIRNGEIVINPTPRFEVQLNSSSLDLFLGKEFRSYKNEDGISNGEQKTIIDLSDDDQNLQSKIKNLSLPIQTTTDGSIVLEPQTLILGVTAESLTLSDKIAARVEGRSTLARLGLLIHVSAPTIHAGFHGTMVLELVNLGHYPLRLFPNKTRICQVIFERTGESASGNNRGILYGQQSIDLTNKDN